MLVKSSVLVGTVGATHLSVTSLLKQSRTGHTRSAVEVSNAENIGRTADGGVVGACASIKGLTILECADAWDGSC